MTPTTIANDSEEQAAKHPGVEYVHELPEAERKRRETPAGFESWDDVDLDAIECKSYYGSESGSLACHASGCPGEKVVELLGEPVGFDPGHPGDFCEEYECIGCGRTGRLIIEHSPVENEFSTVQEFETRTLYTGTLADR